MAADGANGGNGRREGVGFSSQGFGCARSPPHPCLLLWAPATPPASPPTPVSCKPEEEEVAGTDQQQPWAPNPTSRADVFPELRGTQGPSTSGVLRLPGQGVGACRLRACSDGWVSGSLSGGGPGSGLGREGQPHHCSWNRGTGLASAWLHSEVGVTVLWSRRHV